MNERFLNPNWLKIWVKPRAVIRSVLDSGSHRHIHKLAMLGGVGSTLDVCSGANLGDKLPAETILLFCFLVGPLLGLFFLYVWSAFVTWTGRWFGGAGNHVSVRVANAWAAIPQIYGAVIWLLAVVWFGDEIFKKNMPDFENSQWLLLLLVFLVFGINFVWAIFVELKSIAEAHRFSFWKSLITVIVARILLVLVMLSPILIIYGLAIL